MYYPVQLYFDAPFPKTFSSLNFNKLVSAYRLKDRGVCVEEVQATKKLVSRLNLAVQSIYR
jgi:hypothetical protein